METTFNFNNELSGKIALVTGGTKGTGKAIAQRLLDAGATVIITARNKPEEEKEGILFIPADLSQPDGTGNWSRKFWLPMAGSTSLSTTWAHQSRPVVASPH